MRDGFLFGIGLILAIALWPLLVRLAFVGVVIAVVAVVAVVGGLVIWSVGWSLWEEPGALAMALTFGWIPFVGLMFRGFDRFMVWLRNDPDWPGRGDDYSQRLEMDLEDAGYHLPRREPRLLPPVS